MTRDPYDDQERQPSQHDPRLWSMPTPPVVPVGPVGKVWPAHDEPKSPPPAGHAAA